MENKIKDQNLLLRNPDKPVKAIIPGESHHELTINLKGGIDLPKTDFRLPCQPRTELDHQPSFRDFLTSGITDSFAEIDKKMVLWLSRSSENAEAFLNDPIASLKMAGVELKRADEKVIARNFQGFQSENLLSPGMKLNRFETQFKKGKVGDNHSSPGEGNHSNDCICK